MLSNFKRQHLQRARILILLAAAGLVVATAHASNLDAIGLTRLQAVTANLNGAGIRVVQVESPMSENRSAFEVQPGAVGQPASLFTYRSSFGSSTTYPNSAGLESSHADQVARYFYGIPGGVATNVAHVDNDEASWFWSFIIAPASPLIINDKVVNQSFIFEAVSVAQQQTIDSGYDNYAMNYNTLLVSGAGNGGPVHPPATCYNGIGVAAYGGSSSFGPTPDNGRAKPDITAPAAETSFSAPQVAGAAAILMQAALRGDGGSSTKSAADIRTVKALLFNGAVKPSDWTNAPASPLDARFGAGILNVFNSYLQLAGGRHSYIVSSSVPAGSPHPPTGSAGTVSSLRGWDFNVNSSSGTADGVNHYYFNVNNGVSDDTFAATATLVWNRHANQANINNLDLFLYDANSGSLIARSMSAVDNVEHVFVSGLPPGRYDLQVLKNGGATVSSKESYALAFEFVSTSTNTGSLQVAISPAGAVNAGAHWQVDGGAWQDSGATVSALSIGRHTVAFRIVNGWATPANQTVIVRTDQTTTTAGIYNIPFVSMNASYSGLFYDTNGTAHQSSGLATITTTKRGRFSAKLLLTGKSYSFSGQIPDSGSSSNSIARKNSSSVSVQLQFDMNQSDVLTGRISDSDGAWAAELVANRATFHSVTNPAPLAGKYTLAIPGSDDASTQPGGDGFGAVTIGRSGKITFSGVLGDGTKVSQKTIVSKDGRWPFYASLYSGNGSILGWLTFADEPTDDIHGRIDWFKLEQPTAKYYPGGFTCQAEAVGSVYQFTGGVPVLNFSTGRLILANGNLPASVTNLVVAGGKNKLTGTNGLSLTITASSGLFKGRMINPFDGRKLTLSGTVLQKQNIGRGCFLGTTQSGSVWLGLDPQQESGPAP